MSFDVFFYRPFCGSHPKEWNDTGQLMENVSECVFCFVYVMPGGCRRSMGWNSDNTSGEVDGQSILAELWSCNGILKIVPGLNFIQLFQSAEIHE